MNAAAQKKRKWQIQKMANTVNMSRLQKRDSRNLFYYILRTNESLSSSLTPSQNALLLTAVHSLEEV
jgi:hypothetical protein